MDNYMRSRSMTDNSPIPKTNLLTLSNGNSPEKTPDLNKKLSKCTLINNKSSPKKKYIVDRPCRHNRINEESTKSKPTFKSRISSSRTSPTSQRKNDQLNTITPQITDNLLKMIDDLRAELRKHEKKSVAYNIKEFENSQLYKEIKKTKAELIDFVQTTLNLEEFTKCVTIEQTQVSELVEKRLLFELDYLNRVVSYLLIKLKESEDIIRATNTKNNTLTIKAKDLEKEAELIKRQHNLNFDNSEITKSRNWELEIKVQELQTQLSEITKDFNKSNYIIKKLELDLKKQNDIQMEQKENENKLELSFENKKQFYIKKLNESQQINKKLTLEKDELYDIIKSLEQKLTLSTKQSIKELSNLSTTEKINTKSNQELQDLKMSNLMYKKEIEKHKQLTKDLKNKYRVLEKQFIRCENKIKTYENELIMSGVSVENLEQSSITEDQFDESDDELYKDFNVNDSSLEYHYPVLSSKTKTQLSNKITNNLKKYTSVPNLQKVNIEHLKEIFLHNIEKDSQISSESNTIILTQSKLEEVLLNLTTVIENQLRKTYSQNKHNFKHMTDPKLELLVPKNEFSLHEVDISFTKEPHVQTYEINQKNKFENSILESFETPKKVTSPTKVKENYTPTNLKTMFIESNDKSIRFSKTTIKSDSSLRRSNEPKSFGKSFVNDLKKIDLIQRSNSENQKFSTKQKKERSTPNSRPSSLPPKRLLSNVNAYDEFRAELDNRLGLKKKDKIKLYTPEQKLVNKSILTENSTNIETGDIPAETNSITDTKDMPYDSQNDPALVYSITQTMVGDYFIKFTRQNIVTNSMKYHERYFWVHPYTRTINWSIKEPSQNGSTYKRNGSLSRSEYICSVVSVTDNYFKNFPSESIVITTPNRKLKIKAKNSTCHGIWLSALTFLQSRVKNSIDQHISNEAWNDMFNNSTILQPSSSLNVEEEEQQQQQQDNTSQVHSSFFERSPSIKMIKRGTRNITNLVKSATQRKSSITPSHKTIH